MFKEFSIKGRKIGYNQPPLIIAEIGINHEGDIDLAIQMADEAINAGADLLVIGRPITDSKDPLKTIDNILENIKQ